VHSGLDSIASNLRSERIPQPLVHSRRASPNGLCPQRDPGTSPLIALSQALTNASFSLPSFRTHGPTWRSKFTNSLRHHHFSFRRSRPAVCCPHPPPLVKSDLKPSANAPSPFLLLWSVRTGHSSHFCHFSTTTDATNLVPPILISKPRCLHPSSTCSSSSPRSPSPCRCL
jgi:hypothetical protein